MAVYTCIEMIRDCRDGKAAGWAYFVRRFVPFCRGMARHYLADPSRCDDVVVNVLRALRDPAAGFFLLPEAIVERELILALRAPVLEAVRREQLPREPEVAVDLETVSAALEPLSILERQMVWLETMAYDAPRTSVLMRVSPETVGKVRDKAAELLRAKMDHWTRTLLGENGAALGEAAKAAQPEPPPVTVKVLLDAIDGRITWSDRQQMERALAGSWPAIDLFCRVREADQVLREAKALAEPEVDAILHLLGVEAVKPPLWKRILASR